MEIQNKRLKESEFYTIRDEVLKTWPTGKGISIENGAAYQRELPEDKKFARVLKKADDEGRVLLQPRAGVALVDEHINLLKFLEKEADLLPTTIDAYTRNNKYEDAAGGITKSMNAGQSLLNGFPAVNHGIEECRRVIEGVGKPVQVRHGTPDARLLGEITLAAGFSAYEGGGISYNIPYTKKIPLETSIRDWQYVDRLIGLYEERGVRINREPFGPLSGTLVPPFISHCIGIIEGLLALEQGVRSISLGYGQAGNLLQDIAAIKSLRDLAHEFFSEAGFDDYELTTVFHQWMGGFPEKESQAFAVIAWGGAIASMAGASKIITKTPHEAMGIPTREANLQGLEATRQMVNMLSDQSPESSTELEREIEIIKKEVRQVLTRVRELGGGDMAVGSVRAFEAGVLDVPFAPSIYNNGKLLPVRDNYGAVRLLSSGQIPFSDDILDYHKSKIDERAVAEGREPNFQMVIDDIYAISKGKLVGRPR
ncbi:MAG: methylaspartate mutase subunit E [Spirochaetales bacterium]|nr:methylaspartate mutase subunit E [Spirochaetales bacterium]